MRLRFWGVRGSIASPISNAALEAKLKALLKRAIQKNVQSEADLAKFWSSLPLHDRGTYGGNTSCITVHDGDDFLVLDAGTGLRLFGKELSTGKEEIDKPIHILLSHFHWDHIGGFPFFGPAFQEGTRIVIHSPTNDAEKYFKVQQSSPFSPAEFAFLHAAIDFEISKGLDHKKIAGFHVSSLGMSHPGGSMAYRIEGNNGGIVYMTDTELADIGIQNIHEYSTFFNGATLAVVDTMYGLLETYTSKLRWGHSSVFPFIDIVRDTTIKTLVLFHHDPDLDDKDIEEMRERAQHYYEHNTPEGTMEIIAAYDGLELDVPALNSDA
ncbi:MAG: MBL fold metallo-hydrolase [Planctomycetes bacterium]|nr:MBL fold metallo-hydrolase [Planctomycetota bacterium]